MTSQGPLRVLLVNDNGRADGGAELQMLALRDGLRAQGHAARLFTSDAGLVAGFPLLADRACRGRSGRAQVLAQTANLSAWRALRRELREHPPDVVHLRMWLWQLSPLILPLLRRVPVVLQAATYKEICPTGLKLLPDGRECRDRAGRVCLRAGCVAVPTWLSTMLQLALVRRWRGAIDLPTALSARMTEVFAAAGWPGLTVLPNGVDAAAMRPPLAGPPRAAYAGRLSREKGVETLLDAFARIAGELPQARLMIAGTGPLEAALKARAAPLGARVAFLGHLPRPQMEAKFATAWVQVVPSLWHEPFGNVSTEAMMRGTAVIAADVGGQSDIVRDGRTGALVPPGDPAALAAALARYLGDRALAEAQGRAGRAVALAEYSRERNTAMVVEAYRTAIARFAAGARGRGA